MVGMKKPGNWNSLNEIIAEMPEDNGTGFLVIGRCSRRDQSNKW